MQTSMDSTESTQSTSIVKSQRAPLASRGGRLIRNGWRLSLKVLDTRFALPGQQLLSGKKRAQIKQILRPGDLLLETNNQYPGWQFASRLMVGGDWVHSAMYVGNGFVVDIGTKPVVAMIELDEFLKTTDVAIYRPHYKTPEDVKAATAFVADCLGMPFNTTFDHRDRKSFYCTQLIARALLAMPNPITLALGRLMWKPMVPASAIESSPDMDCLFSTRPHLLKAVIAHWDLWLGGASGVYLAHLSHLHHQHSASAEVLLASFGIGIGFAFGRLLTDSECTGVFWSKRRA